MSIVSLLVASSHGWCDKIVSMRSENLPNVGHSSTNSNQWTNFAESQKFIFSCLFSGNIHIINSISSIRCPFNSRLWYPILCICNNFKCIFYLHHTNMEKCWNFPVNWRFWKFHWTKWVKNCSTISQGEKNHCHWIKFLHRIGPQFVCRVKWKNRTNFEIGSFLSWIFERAWCFIATFCFECCQLCHLWFGRWIVLFDLSVNVSYTLNSCTMGSFIWLLFFL